MYSDQFTVASEVVHASYQMRLHDARADRDAVAVVFLSVLTSLLITAPTCQIMDMAHRTAHPHCPAVVPFSTTVVSLPDRTNIAIACSVACCFGTAGEIAQDLDRATWHRLSAVESTKNSILYEWAYLELADIEAIN